MPEHLDERTPLLQGSQPTQDAEAAKKGNENTSVRILVFVMLPMAIGIVLAAMDVSVIVSTYASIGSEFNQLQNVSWIATSYLLTMTCFQPLYGKMSDIFGRKGCLLFAYMVFMIGTLFCGLARNLTELVCARALAGVGGGGMTTLTSIILSDIVPLRQRGTWQGVFNIVYTVGNAAGAPIGGFLTDGAGWRWAFMVQVPVALAAIIAVSLTLHLPTQETEPKPEANVFRNKLARIDFAGAFFLVTSIFCLLVSLDRASNISWTDTYTVISLVAFVVLGSLFIHIEFNVAKEPLTPKHVLTQTSLLANYLCNFFIFASGMTAFYNVPLYLQIVLEKSPHEVGLWVIPTVIGLLVGSLVGGVIIQSTGRYFWIIFASCLIALTGTFVTTISAGVLGRWFIPMIVGWTFTGIGNGSGLTTSLIALIATAGPKDQAMATAVSYLFRSLGSVVSISVGSGILQVILRASLRSRLSGEVEDSELEEIIRRVRESVDSIGDIPGARESYELGIQGVLWFTVVMAVFAWMSSWWIKGKKL